MKIVGAALLNAALALTASVPLLAGLTSHNQKEWSGFTCDAMLIAGTPGCVGGGSDLETGTSSSSNAARQVMLSAESYFLDSTQSGYRMQSGASAYANAGGTIPTLTDTDQVARMFQFFSATSSARLEMEDEIEIFGPSSSGYLEFNLYMHENGETGASGAVGFLGQLYWPRNGLYSTVSIPFTPGQPVEWTAFVEAFASDLQPSDPSRGSAQSFVRLDILSVSLFTQAGQSSDWGYRSASGWRYNAIGGEEVPEPTAIMTTAVGLLGLIGLRRVVVTRPRCQVCSARPASESCKEEPQRAECVAMHVPNASKRQWHLESACGGARSEDLGRKLGAVS